MRGIIAGLLAGGLTVGAVTSLSSLTLSEDLIVTGTTTQTGVATFAAASVHSAGLSAGDAAITNVSDVNVDSVSADGTTVDYMDVNIFEVTQENVGATCTLGQVRYDTATTEELCFCTATDTWGCVSMTTADGPTD